MIISKLKILVNLLSCRYLRELLTKQLVRIRRHDINILSIVKKSKTQFVMSINIGFHYSLAYF